MGKTTLSSPPTHPKKKNILSGNSLFAFLSTVSICDMDSFFALPFQTAFPCEKFPL